jgi:hypothetical protein
MAMKKSCLIVELALGGFALHGLLIFQIDNPGMSN